MKKVFERIGAVGAGVANGMFGAGGGMIAVPLLVNMGKDQPIAQATAMAALLPLSIFSLGSYIISGSVTLSSLPVAFGALFGGYIGSYLFKFIPSIWLSRIFAIFMLIAGFNMVIK